jgi:hypothetical protein
VRLRSLYERLPASGVPGRSLHVYLDKKAGDGSFWDGKQNWTQVSHDTKAIRHIRSFLKMMATATEMHEKVGSALGDHRPSSKDWESRKEPHSQVFRIAGYRASNTSLRLRIHWHQRLALLHGTRSLLGTGLYPLASPFPPTASLTSVHTKVIVSAQEAIQP